MTEWPELMGRWNAAILGSPTDSEELAAEVVTSGWLGRRGTSDDELSQAEEPLGVRLPPSYREFLAFSNGWQSLGRFVANPGRLFGVEELDWVRTREAQWAADMVADGPNIPDSDYFIYGDDQMTYNYRGEYVPHMLQISEWGDLRILLLNPRVTFPDGEWEAWDFASFYPGAMRYRSFWEMMVACYQKADLE